MVVDAGELGDAQDEVSSSREAQNRGARVSRPSGNVAVDGEGFVGEDREEERLEVVDACGEGSCGRFGVVEGDDEDVLAIGKGAVPFVIVADVADAEAAAMDGEECRESGGGGLVVRLGEKDAAAHVGQCMRSPDAS